MKWHRILDQDVLVQLGLGLLSVAFLGKICTFNTLTVPLSNHEYESWLPANWLGNFRNEISHLQKPVMVYNLRQKSWSTSLFCQKMTVWLGTQIFSLSYLHDDWIYKFLRFNLISQLFRIHTSSFDCQSLWTNHFKFCWRPFKLSDERLWAICYFFKLLIITTRKSDEYHFSNKPICCSSSFSPSSLHNLW